MDIIIVDDTQTAIDALAKKLKNYPNVTVAGFANNGKDGLELLKTTHAEVVFLDVEMPDMTGIDFLGRMKDEGCKDTLAVVYLWHLHAAGSEKQGFRFPDETNRRQRTGDCDGTLGRRT